jgi:hypothetical protein
MRPWLLALLALAIIPSSQAWAMGSGPHPTVPFGLPAHAEHGAPGSESIPIEWLILYPVTIVLLICTLRAFTAKRPKYPKPRSGS